MKAVFHFSFSIIRVTIRIYFIQILQIKFISITRRSMFTWITRSLMFIWIIRISSLSELPESQASSELPDVQISFQFSTFRFPSQLFDNYARLNIQKIEYRISNCYEAGLRWWSRLKMICLSKGLIYHIKRSRREKKKKENRYKKSVFKYKPNER